MSGESRLGRLFGRGTQPVAMSWAEARHHLDGGGAVGLWRPGCGYCDRLRRALGADTRIAWVNVWQDADANRVVREHNNGDEYTPTVLVAGPGDEPVVLRNPSPAEVQAALGDPVD